MPPFNFDPQSINYGYGSDTSGFGSGGMDMSGAGGAEGLNIPAGNYNPAALSTAMSAPNFTPMGASGGLGGLGGMLGKAGVGFNMPTFNAAIGGLQTIGSLWSAMQMAGIANQQLKLSRGVANANLANQTQSYNTSLSDRATARGVAEGMNPAAVQDYITKNSLHNRTV